jgi:DNA-binding transcriptional regulator GbsR (MarR family)
MKQDAERFVELMGRHFEEEGAARIAGRLMGVLLLNREPASLDELVDQLRVSKASVSMNARRLELLGIAERVTVAGDRRDFYRIADDFRERMLSRMVDRARLMIERLSVGRDAVRDEPREMRERFDMLIGFFGAACSKLECGLSRENGFRGPDEPLAGRISVADADA